MGSADWIKERVNRAKMKYDEYQAKAPERESARREKEDRRLEREEARLKQFERRASLEVRRSDAERRISKARGTQGTQLRGLNIGQGLSIGVNPNGSSSLLGLKQPVKKPIKLKSKRRVVYVVEKRHSKSRRRRLRTPQRRTQVRFI